METMLLVWTSPFEVTDFFKCSADLRYLHSFPTRRSSDLYFKAPWMPDRTEANPNEPLFRSDRKSGSAGMPRPTSYAVSCLKKKHAEGRRGTHHPTGRRHRVRRNTGRRAR